MKNLLKSFKITAWLEGLSLLILLAIAMPLKYMFDLPQMVQIIGMMHGVLFLIYVVMAFIVSTGVKWPIKTLAIVLVASVVPFGTFYIEKKYLK